MIETSDTAFALAAAITTVVFLGVLAGLAWLASLLVGWWAWATLVAILVFWALFLFLLQTDKINFE